MIFSRWVPDTGGYEYFEAPVTQNINDDLPTPELPPATKIGVPSIEAGRPIPSGAQKVGEGEVALGVLAPVDDSRLVRRTRSLGALGEVAGSYVPVGWMFAGAAGAAILWYMFKKR